MWITRKLKAALSGMTERNLDKDAEKVSEWIASKVWTDPDRTVEQDAQYMGLPVPYLTSFFKRRFGESFISFRTRLRIQEAQMLLRLHPDKTMQQIGEMCGFADRRNFEKHFARMTGERPARWKRKFGN